MKKEDFDSVYTLKINAYFMYKGSICEIFAGNKVILLGKKEDYKFLTNGQTKYFYWKFLLPNMSIAEFFISHAYFYGANKNTSKESIFDSYFQRID